MGVRVTNLQLGLGIGYLFGQGMGPAIRPVVLFSNSVNILSGYSRGIVEHFFALGFELNLALGLALGLGLTLGLRFRESYSQTLSYNVRKFCKHI